MSQLVTHFPLSHNTGCRSYPRADTTHEAPSGSASLDFPSAWHTLALLRFSWSLGNRRDSNNSSFSFLCFDKAPTAPSTKNLLLRQSIQVNLFEHHQCCGIFHTVFSVVNNYLHCISIKGPQQHQDPFYSAQRTHRATNACAWLAWYSKDFLFETERLQNGVPF